MRRSHPARNRTAFPLLPILLAAGLSACGGGQQGVEPLELESVTLYAEPADSTDPLLVFPRDLLRIGRRLYVLDGRLGHVVILDAVDGRPLGRFGGIGEGPGELGMFPFALVTDGSRPGVAHGFLVSWFTPEGSFLERENLPALDLSTPALQRDGRGWLYNAPYRGPGSPVALYRSGERDSTAFGTAVVPEGAEAGPLAVTERNAALPVRLGTGMVLLAWVQENRIDLYDAAGERLGGDRWSHYDPEPERGPDGRIRGMPGFALAASPTQEGGAVVLDGTGRVIRRYGADGRLLNIYRLDEPVLRAIWEEEQGWALDGWGNVVVLRPRPQGQEEGGTEPAAPPPWLGADLPSAITPLTDVRGEPFEAGSDPLRLWVVVSDLECLSCLEEVPVLAAVVEEEGPAEVGSVLLALGDFNEARRSLWGVDTGNMPVAVSANRDLAGLWGGGTPMRLLAWHGRLVEICTLRADRPGGRERLLDMLRRWQPEPAHATTGPIPDPSGQGLR